MLKKDSRIGIGTAVSLGAGGVSGVCVAAVCGVGPGLIVAGLVGVTCYATNKVIERINKKDKKKLD